MESFRTCISYSIVVQNFLHFLGRGINEQGLPWLGLERPGFHIFIIGPLNKLGQINFPSVKPC